jgi:hypothetical protein
MIWFGRVAWIEWGLIAASSSGKTTPSPHHFGILKKQRWQGESLIG